MASVSIIGVVVYVRNTVLPTMRASILTVINAALKSPSLYIWINFHEKSRFASSPLIIKILTTAVNTRINMIGFRAPSIILMGILLSITMTNESKSNVANATVLLQRKEHTI